MDTVICSVLERPTEFQYERSNEGLTLLDPTAAGSKCGRALDVAMLAPIKPIALLLPKVAQHSNRTLPSSAGVRNLAKGHPCCAAAR
jgi:hypothetical protein